MPSEGIFVIILNKNVMIFVNQYSKLEFFQTLRDWLLPLNIQTFGILIVENFCYLKQVQDYNADVQSQYSSKRSIF